MNPIEEITNVGAKAEHIKALIESDDGWEDERDHCEQVERESADRHNAPSEGFNF